MTKFIIEWAAEISAVIRVVSSIIVVFYLLPLQLAQTKVKNGLSKLRWQLLIGGGVIFLTNLISLFFIYDIIVSNTPQKFLNSCLQVVNAVSYLMLSVIAYMIYHQQYTEENRELHAHAAEMENRKIAKKLKESR